MTSSLASQLAGLRSHNAARLASGGAMTSRDSYLFTPRVAAEQDHVTVHALGQTGWEQLVDEDAVLAQWPHGDLLFGEQSIHTDRSTLPKAANDDIDAAVAQFLYLVGPQLLSRSVAKCLEWLVRRFRIHEYSPREVVRAFLPYHLTPQFARMLQLVKLDAHPMLHFLRPVQQAQTPLPAMVLLHAVSGNLDLLRWVACARAPPGIDVRRAHVPFWTSFLVQVCLHRRASKRRSTDAQAFLAVLVPEITYMADARDTEAAVGALMVLCSVGAAFALTAPAVRGLIDGAARLATADASPDVARAVVAACIALCASPEDTSDPFSSLSLLSEPTLLALLALPQLREQWFRALAAHDVAPFSTQLLAALCAHLAHEPAQALLEQVLDEPALPEPLVHRTYVRLLCAPSHEHWDARVRLLAQRRERDPAALDAAVHAAQATDANHTWHVLSAVLQWQASGTVPEADATDAAVWLGVHSADASAQHLALQHLLEAVQAGHVRAGDPLVRGALETALARAHAPLLTLLRKHSATVLEACGAPALLDALRPRTDTPSDAIVPALALAIEAVLPHAPALGPRIGRELVWPRLWPLAGDAAPCVDALPLTQPETASAVPWAHAAATASAAHDVRADPVSWVFGFAQALVAQQAARSEAELLDEAQFLCDALDEPISRGGALALLVLSQLLAQPLPPRVWTALAYRAVVLVHEQQLLAGQVDDVILGDTVDRAIVEQVHEKLSRSTVRLLGVQLLYTVLRHMPVGHDASLFVDVQQRRTPAAQLVLLVYQTLHAPDAGAVASEKLAPVLFERLGSQALALLAGVWTTPGGTESTAPTSVAALADALDTQCVVPRSNVPVRLMAMRHAAMLVRAAAAHARALDLQTLLPSLLVVLQDTVPVLRDAAAQLLCAMHEGNAACESPRDVYGLETVYGTRSAALQYLDAPTYAKYVSLLAHEAGAFVNDASYLAVTHTALLQGSSKKETQFRTKVLCYLLSHAVCTPDLGARTAWLGLVRHVPAPCKLTTVLPLVREAVSTQGRGTTPAYLELLFATYDTTTVPMLEDKHSDAWPQFLEALRHNDAQGLPRAALRALQAGLFSALPMRLRQQVLLELAEVVAHPPTPRVAGGAEALRTLPVSDAVLVQVLRTLCEQVTSGDAEEPTTKKARSAAPSHDRARHAAVVLITVLESLQSRTLGTSAALVAALFDVVRAAIELCTSHLFNAEYLLQLAMQSLCSLFDHITVLPADVAQVVRADTIVSAIQVSANTQSINHAILLLARFARLDAELVLHNIMPIFTFVGLSVLQRDDRFTLSVVEQTLRSIIPAFVNAVRPQVVNDKDARLALWRETRSLLRIFSDASSHIPRHRRHVFFRRLVDVLGTDDFLAPVCMLLADRVAHRVSKSPAHSATLLQLPLGLLRAEPLAVRLRALNQIWAEIARLLAHADDVFLAPAPKREYSEEHLSPTHQAHTLLLLVQHVMYRLERTEAEGCDTELAQYAWHTLHLAPSDAALADALDKARAPAFQALSTPSFLAIELVLLRGETTLAGMPGPLPRLDEPATRQMTALQLWEQRAPLTTAERAAYAEQLGAWHEALVAVWEAQPDTPLGALALRTLRTSLTMSVAAEHASLAALMPRLLRPAPTADVLRVLAALLTHVGVRALAHLATLVPYASQAIESGEDDASCAAGLQLLTALFKTLPQFMHAHSTRTLRLLCARSMQARLSTAAVRHAHHQVQEALVKKMPAATVLEAWTGAWKDEQVVRAALLPILQHAVREMSRDDVGANYKLVFRLLLPALDTQREEQDAERLGPVVQRALPVYVALALKLSESQFRPLFLRTYDWAVVDLLDEDAEGLEARTLVLYVLIQRLLEQLHAMFVPFYAIVWEHAVSQLRTQSPATALWQAVTRSVRRSAEADEGTFWNAARATPLVSPLTAALVDPDAGASGAADEARDAVLALASAVPDDAYLGALHRALLALANESGPVAGRVRALETCAALWEAHGVALLTFVPDTVATLAEACDEADPRAAAAALALRAQVEAALGEPLDTYLDTA